MCMICALNSLEYIRLKVCLSSINSLLFGQNNQVVAKRPLFENSLQKKTSVKFLKQLNHHKPWIFGLKLVKIPCLKIRSPKMIFASKSAEFIFLEVSKFFE